MAKHAELSSVMIYSFFSRFVAVIWRAKEFSCNYFSDCFIIVRIYSLIRFVLCTEVLVERLMLKNSSLLPTVIFRSAQPHAPLWRSIHHAVQSACSKTCHVIVTISFPLNRTARQLEVNIRK